MNLKSAAIFAGLAWLLVLILEFVTANVLPQLPAQITANRQASRAVTGAAILLSLFAAVYAMKALKLKPKLPV